MSRFDDRYELPYDENSRRDRVGVPVEVFLAKPSMVADDVTGGRIVALQSDMVIK